MASNAADDVAGSSLVVEDHATPKVVNSYLDIIRYFLIVVTNLCR